MKSGRALEELLCDGTPRPHNHGLMECNDMGNSTRSKAVRQEKAVGVLIVEQIRLNLRTSYSSIGQTCPIQWLPRWNRFQVIFLCDPSNSSIRSMAAWIIIYDIIMFQENKRETRRKYQMARFDFFFNIRWDRFFLSVSYDAFDFYAVPITRSTITHRLHI